MFKKGENGWRGKKMVIPRKVRRKISRKMRGVPKSPESVAARLEAKSGKAFLEKVASKLHAALARQAG